MPVRSLVVTWITLGETGVSTGSTRAIALGTWSTPARACWGEPPQLSTENHLRKEFEGLDHSSRRILLFDPLDQELSVIWEPRVNGDDVGIEKARDPLVDQMAI
jgi:hypothetical protein